MTAGRRLAVLLGATLLGVAVPAGAAHAHPLGNFTVNHHDQVQLHPDRVELTAVVDRAEIPTAQTMPSIAPDGSPGAGQLAAAAQTQCGDVAAAITLSVAGQQLPWMVGDSTMEVVPGAAGLPTLRLTCAMRADADLRVAAEVTVSDTYQDDRVGWREMTADGTGVRLIDSPVPAVSVSDELRSYPADLLTSPLDVRSFTVATEPGSNTDAGSAVTRGTGDPFSSAMAAMDRQLEDLVGDRGLTPWVGALAILLAVLLGCGHALLPGHGKTVMAAYLAGRRGSSRDAVTVGATVTATHTVGVLVLGLAISLSSTLAGDQVIRWLGVVSGLLVAGIGAAMLRTAVPLLRAPRSRLGPAAEVLPEPVLAGALGAHPGTAGSVRGSVAPRPSGHVHGDGHPDEHGHEHAHGHPHPQDHEHAHGHPHPQDHGHEHRKDSWWAGGQGHSHGPGGHTHTHGPAGGGRGGLIGMGIAGGLVPSPSALIVLLASVGLGRTLFGVVLVLAYGIGMAGTLTAVGLLLVRMRDRVGERLTQLRWARALGRVAPVVTAVLVLVVGLALISRGVVLGA